MNLERGEAILSAIYDDVDHRLNPEGHECWNCDGLGYTYDCIDEFCAQAEYGCPTCERRCPECAIFAGNRAKAIRLQVIELGDIDVAAAWIKERGRWHDGITETQIRDELSKARTASAPIGRE